LTGIAPARPLHHLAGIVGDPRDRGRSCSRSRLAATWRRRAMPFGAGSSCAFSNCSCKQLLKRRF